MTKLDDVEQEMMDAAGMIDKAGAHYKADRVLCKTIRLLAIETGQEKQAERIIQRWLLIDKWYA